MPAPRAFNERDKFVLDQYIMQGGKVLWFIDMVKAIWTASVRRSNSGTDQDQLNIEDLLFRYGARINPVLVQDIQCNTIPVNVALAGNAADFRPAPWLYVLCLPLPYAHPITRNLNMISIRFAGTMDTIEARKRHQENGALLKSSEYSRQVSSCNDQPRMRCD